MSVAGSAAAGRVGRRGYGWTVTAQLAGRFGSMAANIASIAIIARVLPQDQFGIYVLVTGVVFLLAQIADFGTGPIFGQHVGTLEHVAETEGVRLAGRDWGSFLLLRGLLAAVATVAGLLGSLAFDAATAAPMVLASLSVAFVAGRVLDPLYQVAQRPFLSTLTQLAGAGALIGAAVLVALLHPTLIWFVAAFGLANAAYVAAALLAARPLIAGRLGADAGVLRRTLALAAPIGAAGLMTAVNGRANLLFLEHFQGPEAVALYGAATRVLDLAVNMAVVVLGPLIPIFSRSAQAGVAALAAEFRAALSLLLQLTLPLLVAAPYLSPVIVRALYGARYEAAADTLQLLAWVGFGVALSLLASYALLALRVTGYAIRITASSVVANLLLNALLVPMYGPRGAAIASVCSEAVLVTLVTLALRRHVPAAIAWRPVLAALARAAALAVLLRVFAPLVGSGAVVLALLPCGASVLALARARRR